MRSSAGPMKRREQQHSQHRHNPMRHKRKPPRGMYLSEEDLRLMLTGPPQQAEQILKSLDMDLISLKRQVRFSYYQYWRHEGLFNSYPFTILCYN